MTKFLTGFTFILCPLLLMICLVGCDIDDEEVSFNLEASDLSISVLENRALGEELGQVIASAEGAELIFAVMSAEPEGAFVMDATRGIVKVADASFFDFESRETMSAIVKVSAGTESREVNVFVELEDELADPVSFNALTKNWITDKFSFNGIFSAMDVHSCRLDDEMRISGTGSYTYDGGAELCGNEDNQQLKTGTWDLDEHLKFVLFDKGEENEYRAEIDFFENGKLSLSSSWMGIPISGEYLAE